MKLIKIALLVFACSAQAFFELPEKFYFFYKDHINECKLKNSFEYEKYNFRLMASKTKFINTMRHFIINNQEDENLISYLALEMEAHVPYANWWTFLKVIFMPFIADHHEQGKKISRQLNLRIYKLILKTEAYSRRIVADD